MTLKIKTTRSCLGSGAPVIILSVQGEAVFAIDCTIWRLATTLTSPWCRLGTCECLAWEVFAKLRRVTTGQHCPLARATAGARAQGSGALTPRTGDKETL
jgi:hypothetical protein